MAGTRSSHTEAFSFQIATDTHEETDRSWQITPRVLMDALAAGGAEAKRVFAAMLDMGKIDVGKIEAARRG